MAHECLEDGCSRARDSGREIGKAGDARGRQLPANPVRFERADCAVPIPQRLTKLCVQVEVAAPPRQVGLPTGREYSWLRDGYQDQVGNPEPPADEQLTARIHFGTPLSDGGIARPPQAPHVVKFERIRVAERDPGLLLGVASRSPPGR